MSDEKRKKRKHRTVTPYFTTPVVFVAIALLFVIPMCVVMLNVSVNLVHRAQTKFTATVADYSVSDESYVASEQTDGSVQLNKPYGFTKIGELSCNKAGFKTSVYSGANRASYREGAGLLSEEGLPGEGKRIVVNANASGGFKALYNVKSGDVITFQTSWGLYKYKVYSAQTEKELPATEGETLVLVTARNKDAFSVLNQERTIVCASYVSGPKVEGVQNEQ